MELNPDEQIVQCSSCDEDLFVVIVVNPDSAYSSCIISTCPFCGDESWTKELSGDIAVCCMEGRTAIDNIEMDIDENVLSYKLKLVKDKQCQ